MSPTENKTKEIYQMINEIFDHPKRVVKKTKKGREALVKTGSWTTVNFCKLNTNCFEVAAGLGYYPIRKFVPNLQEVPKANTADEQSTTENISVSE